MSPQDIDTLHSVKIDTATINAVVKIDSLAQEQAVSILPADSSDNQTDTIIAEQPKAVASEWNLQIDSLVKARQQKDKEDYETALPQYYRESFFSKSPFFHPELPGGRPGVAGDPIPYTIASDDVMTCLLIGCFILATVALAQSKQFIIRQAKNFFRKAKGNTSDMAETGSEMRFQLFFVLQTCLLLAIIAFFYLQTHIAETFTVSQYQIIAMFTGIVVAYFLAKAILYRVANLVFFDAPTNSEWLYTMLFLVATEGVLLFPVVMLQAYFSLSVYFIFTYTIIVVSVIKLLTLYKSKIIFFKQKGSYIQIILYFCALEIIPAISLWGIFITMSQHLQIKF